MISTVLQDIERYLLVSFEFKTFSPDCILDTYLVIFSLLLPHHQPAFELPEEQVVVLGHVQNLKTGDVVMAVYPETTAFYSTFVSVSLTLFCMTFFVQI